VNQRVAKIILKRQYTSAYDCLKDAVTNT